MCPYLSAIRLDVLPLFMLLSSLSVGITTASTSSDTVRQADECKWIAFAWSDCIERLLTDIMTSAIVDGIKRSNVCGDGYRIEGAVLKSYPYSAHETYLPYEDCTMTFQVELDCRCELQNADRLRLLGSPCGSSCSYSYSHHGSERYSFWDELLRFTSFLSLGCRQT